MPSIFDKTSRDQVIERIQKLDTHIQPQWGKMNIYQMLKHCVLCEEMYQGKTSYKRTFMGLMFGKIALKNILRDDRPFQRNAPTLKAFVVNENNGNVEAEKQKWIALMQDYARYSNEYLVHWFFGKMNKDEVGRFVFKHTDHHLKQFGC